MTVPPLRLAGDRRKRTLANGGEQRRAILAHRNAKARSTPDVPAVGDIRSDSAFPLNVLRKSATISARNRRSPLASAVAIRLRRFEAVDMNIKSGVVGLARQIPSALVYLQWPASS
jgi:hypothetical protein